MQLTLADKLALIYTSQGSMRKTAALCGLTHQQVSRILHKQAEGLPLTHYTKRADVVQAIDTGLAAHSTIAKAVAQRQKLPFTAEYPVMAQRLALRNLGVYDRSGKQLYRGEPDAIAQYIKENKLEGRVTIKRLLGDRVSVENAHWLTDKLRGQWLTKMSKSRRYYSASVGSVVNLRRYNAQAEERSKERRAQGLSPRTDRAMIGKEQLRIDQREGVDQKRIFTPYAPMSAEFPAGMIAQSIQQTLEARHAPATGEKGTSYADQILLQLDTRKNADTPKARGTARSVKRGNRKR